jgi:hypothetical protein
VDFILQEGNKMSEPRLEDDIALDIESDDCKHGIDRGYCEECSEGSDEPDRMWGDND